MKSVYTGSDSLDLRPNGKLGYSNMRTLWFQNYIHLFTSEKYIVQTWYMFWLQQYSELLSLRHNLLDFLIVDILYLNKQQTGQLFHYKQEAQ